MADLNDFRNKVNQLKKTFEEEMPNVLVNIALTAKALSEKSILEKGIGKEYSQQRIPVWFFAGKEINNQGLDYIKSKTEKRGKRKTNKLEDISEADLVDGLGNWKEFREAQGLPSEFVNLHYSNKMYAGILPGEPEIKGYVYSIYLTANDQETMKKMGYNFERYGDFIMLALTPNDIKILNEYALSEQNRLIKIVNIEKP